MPRDKKPLDSPSTLVAIAVAARAVGDKYLSRDAAQKLKERFGVRLVFTKGPRKPSEVVACK